MGLMFWLKPGRPLAIGMLEFKKHAESYNRKAQMSDQPTTLYNWDRAQDFNIAPTRIVMHTYLIMLKFMFI